MRTETHDQGNQAKIDFPLLYKSALSFAGRCPQNLVKILTTEMKRKGVKNYDKEPRIILRRASRGQDQYGVRPRHHLLSHRPSSLPLLPAQQAWTSANPPSPLLRFAINKYEVDNAREVDSSVPFQLGCRKKNWVYEVEPGIGIRGGRMVLMGFDEMYTNTPGRTTPPRVIGSRNV